MAATKKETWACQPSTERGRGILLGAHGPSRQIAYCNGKAVILRSLDNPTECTIYADHSYPCTVARFSPNGEWVASGDVSGSVRIWARRGENALKFEFKAFAGSIDDLCWSEDGERIVVSGDGRQHFVRAFMWDTGAGLGDFEGHSKRVLSCAFRPKRPFRVFTCGEDFAVNFYEGPPFKFKTSHKLHTNFVNCVRFSPDGDKVISVSSDKKGFLYDGKTGQKLGELDSVGAHTGSIYAASWSPDSKHVLTVSADKTAKVWMICDTGSKGVLVTTYKFSASGVEQSPAGPTKLFGGPTVPVEFMQVGCLWVGETMLTISLNGTINLIPASSLQSPCPPPPVPFTLIQGHTKTVNSMAPGPNSDLFTASYDGTVVCWKGEKGAGTALGGKGHLSIVGIASGAGQLVTVGLDDTLRLTSFPASGFSPSSPTVALSGQPRSLSVASSLPSSQPPLSLVATVKGLQLFRGTEPLCSQPFPFEPSVAALSPDGRKVAVGSASGGTIYLFTINAGGGFKESGTLERHRGPVSALAYSPNGAYLASGDQNREAVVWDMSSNEAKLANLVYHNARISCLAWSPDSKRVATGSVDTSIIVYQVDEPASQRVTIKQAHVGGVSALLFLKTASLVSAGLDACLHMWELP